MDSCQLVELAAMISAHAETLIHSPRRMSARNLARYESVCERRFVVWNEDLARYRAAVQTNPDPAQGAGPWQALRPTLEEIFTGDVLVRVWGALAAAHDLVDGLMKLEPIARRVLTGQIEANNRAMSLLVAGHHVRLDQAAEMNRLRHRVERWTDLLMAPILSDFGMAESAVESFAVHPERAREFAEDLGPTGRRQLFERAWPLVAASLREAFGGPSRGPAICGGHAELNAELAQSVLACFPPECFCGAGSFASAWVVRLCRGGDDVSGMLRELIPRPSQNRLTLPAGRNGRIPRN